MNEYHRGQLDGVRSVFEIQRIPVMQVEYQGTPISYYVIPKDKPEGLLYKVMAMTSTDRKTGEKSGIFSVSGDISPEMQPYFVIREYLDHIVYGSESPQSTVIADKEILALLPNELKNQYVHQRLILLDKFITYVNGKLNEEHTEFTQQHIDKADLSVRFLTMTRR